MTICHSVTPETIIDDRPCGANIHIADAHQPKKIPRIGYLTGVGSAPNEAFLQGLRDLGYVEGKNVLIEFRTTRGKCPTGPTAHIWTGV